MEKNTIIFDFDGTLVDSFLVSVRISNTLAPIFGFKTVTEAEVPALRRLSLQELFKRLEIPVHRLPGLLARARKDIAVEIPTIKLFDDIGGLLERLLQEDLRLGIVTSNSTKNVNACLKQNNVLDMFDFVHSATNLFGKHRVLTRLMKKKSIDTQHVLYVGDEARDIEASKKCNIPVAAVTWGYQAKERLVVMEPDFIAENPSDLEKIVKQLFKLS